MGGSVSWDGVLVAFGVLAFFSLVVFFLTPGLGSRAFDGLLRTFFHYRDIYKPEGLYLRRFFITPYRWLGYDAWTHRTRWPRVLGWVPVKYRKIFVHHILLSDDRTPHDHPWDFTTRILAGEYLEYIGGARDFVARNGSPGAVFRNHAEHVHTLEIVRPVWSLVFAGESRRVWGFWETDSRDVTTWIDWRTYLGCPRAANEPEDQIDPSRYPDAEAFDWECRIRRAIPVSPIVLDAEIVETEAEIEERNLWDVTLLDGLEDDAVPTSIDDVPTLKIASVSRNDDGTISVCIPLAKPAEYVCFNMSRDDGPAGEDAPKGKE